MDRTGPFGSGAQRCVQGQQGFSLVGLFCVALPSKVLDLGFVWWPALTRTEPFQENGGRAQLLASRAFLSCFVLSSLNRSSICYPSFMRTGLSRSEVYGRILRERSTSSPTWFCTFALPSQVSDRGAIQYRSFVQSDQSNSGAHRSTLGEQTNFLHSHVLPSRFVFLTLASDPDGGSIWCHSFVRADQSD